MKQLIFCCFNNFPLTDQIRPQPFDQLILLRQQLFELKYKISIKIMRCSRSVIHELHTSKRLLIQVGHTNMLINQPVQAILTPLRTFICSISEKNIRKLKLLFIEVKIILMVQIMTIKFIRSDRTY